MVPGLLIRPAQAVDLGQVTPLAGSRDRAETRLRAAERGDDSMLVAVLADAIVAAASIRWTGGCDPPNPWLYGLHVSAEVQRHGIGRALTRAAEDLAGQRGAGPMSLDVDVGDDRAIAFYEALGYAVVRPHQHHWRALDPRTGVVINEGTAPTLIMRLSVSREPCASAG